MGKDLDVVLSAIEDLKRRLGHLDAKMEKIIKKQIELEKKVDSFEKIYKILNSLPAKLNTTSYQIISQLEESIDDIEEEFSSKIDESIGKLETLVDVNHRLDIFEENLKAYIEKMRYMLMELEDSLRGR